ncbi:FecCD family ABC transporter permease [Arsenicicoccus dermatophilus]|uniref:FecCD family ABC transporter permease n=1 Tax=Arsenicicoccus dermatophilus TaxID=1076331 RepID=UPI001F4D15F6|nr:iron ABC transporter permease [Arsenicicoccus dermatophilus]MCH8614418.1 iron ABC transporter permease [Arsenicicoccus dermatophilus]
MGRSVSWAAAAVLLAVILLSAATGPLDTGLVQVAQIVAGHLLPGMPWMVDGSITASQDQAVWSFRLPRSLLAAVAGGNLALAGALLQVTVRNPLAEPYILGVSAGAGLGAVVAIVAGATALTAVTLNMMAFLGAVLAIVLVYVLAQDQGVVVPARLILAGVALGSLLSGVTNFLLMTTEAQNIYSVLHFLLGSVSAATWASLVPPVVALVVGLLVVLPRGRPLNALLAGDEAATALGVDVPRLHRALLLVAAVLTASTVSVAGGIGFVGLIVPHVVRMVVGSDHRRVLPLTVLGGAVFLPSCDLLARSVAEPVEVPLGVLTAVVGAPFFLWLMRRKAV